MCVSNEKWPLPTSNIKSLDQFHNHLKLTSMSRSEAILINDIVVVSDMVCICSTSFKEPNLAWQGALATIVTPFIFLNTLETFWCMSLPTDTHSDVIGKHSRAFPIRSLNPQPGKG